MVSLDLPLVEIGFWNLPKFVVQFLNLEELFLSTSLRLQVQVQPKPLLPTGIESDLTMKILLLRHIFLRFLKTNFSKTARICTLLKRKFNSGSYDMHISYIPSFIYSSVSKPKRRRAFITDEVKY